MDTRAYDDGGRMLTRTNNNGVAETRAYNTDNTLSSISYTGAAIGNLSYGCDDNRNKTSAGITGTMSGYGFDVGSSGYDDEDRLVHWERDDTNFDKQSWDLSLVGDWDFDNRMVSADVDNDSTDDVFYEWDELGRRVVRDDGTTDTVFVQSGQQTIADYASGTAANSPTDTYVYASYIDEPVVRDGSGGLRYYHRNQQYSVSALTDSNGVIKERYAYDAYGTPTILDAGCVTRTATDESNRHLYTGREYDEILDLYHYRARMYDSIVGRFCSRDPIGYVGGVNHFAYVSGSPLDAQDPSGFSEHINVFPEDDQLCTVLNLQATEDGVIIVGGHGSTGQDSPVGTILGPDGSVMDIEAMINIIKLHPQYHPGAVIRLQVCWAGRARNQCERIANSTGLTVYVSMSPVNYIWRPGLVITSPENGQPWLPVKPESPLQGPVPDPNVILLPPLLKPILIPNQGGGKPKQ